MTGRPKRAKEDKERHLADMNAIEEEYALLKTRSETPPSLSLFLPRLLLLRSYVTGSNPG